MSGPRNPEAVGLSSALGDASAKKLQLESINGTKAQKKIRIPLTLLSDLFPILGFSSPQEF